jgi:CRP-like cAMP-binding protein
MIEENPQNDGFKHKLRASLEQARNSKAMKVERNAVIYTRGDRDEKVYFIESGQIKLLALAREGME